MFTVSLATFILLLFSVVETISSSNKGNGQEHQVETTVSLPLLPIVSSRWICVRAGFSTFSNFSASCRGRQPRLRSCCSQGGIGIRIRVMSAQEVFANMIKGSHRFIRPACTEDLPSQRIGRNLFVVQHDCVVWRLQ